MKIRFQEAPRTTAGVLRIRWITVLVLAVLSNHRLVGESKEDPQRMIPLDSKRLFALGMIESGNDDSGVGQAGEISRYQIQPAVWKSYSDSSEYRNPDAAEQVVRQHWEYLSRYFKEQARRDPTDFDMYVLWNTRFGYYASKGFSPGRLHDTIRDRARRFVNLIHR